MMSLSMEDWPEELLSAVFNGIEADADALVFRSLSSKISQKTSFSFERRFFRTRSVKYNRDGLQKLLSVANDEGLRQVVEEITINLQRWDHQDLHAKIYTLMQQHDGTSDNSSRRSRFNHDGVRHPMFGRQVGWRERKDESGDKEKLEREEAEEISRRAAAFDEELRALLGLLEFDAGQALLTTALAQLPRVRSVSAIDNCTRYCWDAGGALDGAPCGNPSKLRRSWTVLGEDYGGIERLQSVERTFAFTETMRSLCTAEPLQHLISLHVHVTPFEFNHRPIDMPAYLQAQLESLTCTFTGATNDLRRDAQDVFGRSEKYTHNAQEAIGDWLVGWVNGMSNLKSLTIHMPNWNLARKIPSLAEAIRLPKLEHLGLSGFLLDYRDFRHYESLSGVLRRHETTLRSVNLADIFLGSNGLGGYAKMCGDLLELLASLGGLEEFTFRNWSEKAVWPGDQLRVWFSGSEGKEAVEEERKNGWHFKGTAEETQNELRLLKGSYLTRWG